MGNSEDGKSVKPEKSSSPLPPHPQDHSNIHVYPDCASIQAYYGHRIGVAPFFNSVVVSGQALYSYTWGPPQPMIPPYGTPYAAVYPHGGVYAHPNVPLAASPLNMDAPVKSSGTMDCGLMKKLKGFDGVAMSTGNGNADSNEGGMDPRLSKSGETEGFCNGSDGNTKGAGRNGHKRSRKGSPNMSGQFMIETQSNPQANTSEKVMGTTVGPARVTGKVVGPVVSPSVTSSLELNGSPSANVKSSSIIVQPPSTVVSDESWLCNDLELKRERRKLSNRESARRSRLRKQAEAEELAIKVDSLTAENVTLKSEIDRFTENSEKLKSENAELTEMLKHTQLGQPEDEGIRKIKKKEPIFNTANLLSRVDNAGPTDKDDGECEIYEQLANSGSKLHQLLDASPRSDALVAG